MLYRGIEYECYIIEDNGVFFGICIFISYEEYTYAIKKNIDSTSKSEAKKKIHHFAKEFISFNLC